MDEVWKVTPVVEHHPSEFPRIQQLQSYSRRGLGFNLFSSQKFSAADPERIQTHGVAKTGFVFRIGPDPQCQNSVNLRKSLRKTSSNKDPFHI
jgi:hypothetical protein